MKASVRGPFPEYHYLQRGKDMDVKSEIEFLLLLDNKVTILADKIAVIGPLIEVIAMIKGRIQALQHEAEFHSDTEK
jgi:hypothetical protein